MMRKILPVLAVLLVFAFAAGCSCTGTTVNPTPTPKASTSPLNSPTFSASPELSASPGMSALPSTSPDAAQSPNAGGTTGAGTIENFQEGEEVSVTDIPTIKKAIEDKYPGAEITSVKYAMQEQQQAYAVTFKANGKEQTVFVTADGQIQEATATPGA